MDWRAEANELGELWGRNKVGAAAALRQKKETQTWTRTVTPRAVGHSQFFRMKYHCELGWLGAAGPFYTLC